MAQQLQTAEPKTKAEVINLLKHLENEHRKASISDNTYKELKAKYKAEMQYLENTINDPSGSQTAITPQPEPQKNEIKEADSKVNSPREKRGIFGNLFNKEEPKEEKTDIQQIQQPAPQSQDTNKPVEEEKEITAGINPVTIELEKLKVMLDVIREQKAATDESLRNILESIGEIRSMSIQNDATASELTTKLERLEDEISQVKPKEIDKKMRDTYEKLEKFEASLEKTQAKSNDLSERINKTYEIMKGIGGIENLMKINDEIQKKLNDIHEAMTYIERLSSKTERVFIDLKSGLDDMILYKAKQESVEEGLKDLTKSIDNISSKMDGYATKKDLESDNNTVNLMQKEIDNISKIMAIAQNNIPEPIMKLKREKDDIKIFLNSLEIEHKKGKIKSIDYEEIRKKNEEKLQNIENLLNAEWKKIEEGIKTNSEKNSDTIPNKNKTEEAVRSEPQNKEEPTQKLEPSENKSSGKNDDKNEIIQKGNMTDFVKGGDQKVILQDAEKSNLEMQSNNRTLIGSQIPDLPEKQKKEIPEIADINSKIKTDLQTTDAAFERKDEIPQKIIIQKTENKQETVGSEKNVNNETIENDANKQKIPDVLKENEKKPEDTNETKNSLENTSQNIQVKKANKPNIFSRVFGFFHKKQKMNSLTVPSNPSITTPS